MEGSFGKIEPAFSSAGTKKANKMGVWVRDASGKRRLLVRELRNENRAREANIKLEIGVEEEERIAPSKKKRGKRKPHEPRTSLASLLCPKELIEGVENALALAETYTCYECVAFSTEDPEEFCKHLASYEREEALTMRNSSQYMVGFNDKDFSAQRFVPHNLYDFNCELCGQPFNTIAEKIDHLKLHNREGQKFIKTCFFCKNSKQYQNWKAFWKHLRSHGGACYLCGDLNTGLKQACVHLMRHINEVVLKTAFAPKLKIPNDMSTICQYCGDICGSGLGLWKHLKVHLLEAYNRCTYCERCDRRFSNTYVFFCDKNLTLRYIFFSFF